MRFSAVSAASVSRLPTEAHACFKLAIIPKKLKVD
jgi:hypothetical protein